MNTALMMMTDAEELQQEEAVTMATKDVDEDVFMKANDLLQDVDANIVKTATLRKQMPVKCAQLLARRCRLQLLSIQKQSVKSAVPSYVSSTSSFEPVVNDDVLQSLHGRVSQLKEETERLSSTWRHLVKAQQIHRSNERMSSLIGSSS